MKRLIDLVLATALLTVSLPVMALVYCLVRLSMGSPAIFRQYRPGLNGTLFTLYKFRTMTDERNDHGLLLPDEQRLTRVGAFLRSASLDELPQLWNVIAGDMSLVGPRPLLPEYLPRYSPRQARRHEVRPGITGWAQVNGRNTSGWPKKLELDVWYVEHQSIWLDIKILFMTLGRVLKRENIAAETNFQGNSSEPFAEAVDEPELMSIVKR